MKILGLRSRLKTSWERVVDAFSRNNFERLLEEETSTDPSEDSSRSSREEVGVLSASSSETASSSVLPNIITCAKCRHCSKNSSTSSLSGMVVELPIFLPVSTRDSNVDVGSVGFRFGVAIVNLCRTTNRR